MCCYKQISSGGNKDTVADLVEELDEEEMLKRAIAMSLQGKEEELFSLKTLSILQMTK